LARYKAEVLAAYDKLARAERGAFLRREGLYTSNIAERRHQRDRGALADSLVLLTAGSWSSDDIACQDRKLRRDFG
jgi:hypothetical protein